MDVVLWILQWALALAMLVGGGSKAFLPPEKLLANPKMGWVADVGIQRTRTAGFAEVLAAFGLVLPGLTGLPSYFTPLAALGILVVQSLAVITVHRPRQEPIAINLFFGGWALVVLIGRLLVPFGG